MCAPAPASQDDGAETKFARPKKCVAVNKLVTVLPGISMYLQYRRRCGVLPSGAGPMCTARYRVLPTTFALGPVMPMYALPDVTGALPVDDQRVRMP